MDSQGKNGREDEENRVPLTEATVTAKPRSRARMKERATGFLRENLLLVLTLGGVLVGFGLGFVIRTTSPSDNTLMWIGLPGQMYLRSLKMMIVPLIVSSVITGTASLDPKVNGRISMVAFLFIFLTNTIGAVLGVSASLLFNPGSETGGFGTTKPTQAMESQDIFADLLRNIVPDNLVQATFSQTQTKYDYVNKTVMRNTSNGMVQDVEKVVQKRVGRTGGANLLGLITACTLLGMASSSLKEKSASFIQFFTSCTEIIIVVIRWLMWSTPVGVISLISVAIAGVHDIAAIFSGVGMFVATVFVAIAIQQVVVMPTIYFIGVRKNPFRFIFSMTKPWLIAFATTSTAVVIPEMILICETVNRIDSRVTRFVIPFSVTLSANGSAVFISASCLFIANLTGLQLSIGDICLIGMLSAVSSLAIPSVPSASIVTIIMILSSMSISVDAIALLLALEWLLDRLRTTSSVLSHTMCAAVTHKLCQKFLSDGDKELDMDKVPDTTLEIIVGQLDGHVNIPMKDL